MERACTIYNSKSKIWAGRKMPQTYHRDVSIAQIILSELEKSPNRVVQISDDSGIEVTSDEIRVRSIRAALHLLKLNLTNDDCIGVVALNNHHLAPIFVAALLLGVPIHSLDPSIDSADVSYHFGLSKPKIIFCDDDMLERTRATTNNIGLKPIFVTFDDRLDDAHFVEEYFEPIDDEDNFIPIQIENCDRKIGLIVCSSGTTGVSKAICLSIAQITQSFTAVWKQTRDDVYLCFSTVHWVSGILSILSVLYNGCLRIITRKRYTPELFVKIVQKYGVTQFFGPPSQLGLLYQLPDEVSADLSSIKNVFCGGTSVPEEYAVRMRKYFKNAKFNTGYGLSELGGLISMNFIGDAKHVGHIWHNIEVKIVDECGNNLNINEDGEIVIRSDFTFLGYKGDPELSKNVLNTDGWIYSGDIGHFDENGHLYIVDRKKDILKYRGFIISPSEIEQFLMKFNYIESICVVGIPNEISGELPAAVLVPSEQYKLSGSDLSIEEMVYDLVRNNLADYKLLRGGVYVVDKLPMTPSGKIMRHKALDLATKLFNLSENV